MSIANLAVKSPVMAIMLNMAFILFGILSYFKVGVQQNPNLNYPVITVITMMPGGDAKVITETISKPIEESLNTISGVKNIHSTSTPGKSQVEIQFKLGSNIDSMFNEIQSQLSHVKSHFLAGTKAPIIQKSQLGAQPIMLIGLYGKQNIQKLDMLARTTIQKNLQGLPGVAEVKVVGSGKVVLMIELNLEQMASLNISPAMVQRAFKDQHVQLPGGFVDAGHKQFSLGLDLEFHNLDKLNHMVVAYRKKAPIFLKEIATLKFTVPDKSHIATLNGETALGINIIKRPEANTIQVVNDVKSRLKKIEKLLPDSVNVSIVYEKASYILAAIGELESDTILSVFAAGFIIWIFLQNLGATAIVITAIPVSLLGAVIAIYFGGYTLNTITLLAIILLVGVVVDDAIVVLENIYRHLQEKKQCSKMAAIIGTNQVSFTVLAATLSILSIFVPVFFMDNRLGLLFKSFAVVVSTGVIISLFVSLTLTPVLCARFLKVKKNKSRLNLLFERFFIAMDERYKITLAWTLRHRWLMVVFVLIIISSSVPLLTLLDKGLMPENADTGHFQILVQTPQGSSATFTKSIMKQAETITSKIEGVDNYFGSIEKANTGTISVSLLAHEKRQLSQNEIIALIKHQLKKLPGALFILRDSHTGSNMTFEIKGDNFKNTIKEAFKFYNVLSQNKSLGAIYIHLSLNQPEYKLLVDRVMAKSLGLSAQEIGAAVMVLNKHGVKVAKFNKVGGDHRYDIVIKASGDGFIAGDDLDNIYLVNNHGKRISLDTIATFKNSKSPLEITRTNQQYSVPFSASPSISLGNAIILTQQVANQTLPKGYSLSLTGDTKTLGQTQRSMMMTFALIIILMYMVLASQFNSFIQPLIIMLAQPLALIGGLLILWLTNQTLNMYSMIGGLLLMGLVAKNSILLIDLTNHYRANGMSVNEALKAACPERLRPVLMTSCAIILAMLPAAIMSGDAMSAEKPLTYVIIGGMLSSTVLTLIIVPAIYSLVSNTLERFQTDKS